jgi:predicted anti-sigma-YlaC factor YlaD
MLCREVARLLPEYADDALREAQSEAVAAHLRGCEDCRGELAGLESALGALTAVAREPAPDLWAQFQSRLQAEEAVASCRQVAGLLPDYADGELALAQDRLVRAHLAACTPCSARQQALARPMQALQAASQIAPANLWPAFTSRLASTVTCEEVEEKLPAYLAGEAAGLAIALQAHLGVCARCEAAASMHQAAAGALSRVAANMPEVDLWPAFERRLREERARRPFWAGLGAQLASMGEWLRGPLLQPALGVAAFVLITVAGSQLPGLIQRQAARTAVAPAPLAPNVEAGAERSTTATNGPTSEATVVTDEPRKPVVTMAAAAADQPGGAPEPQPGATSPDGGLGEIIERRDPSVPPSASAPGIRVAFNLPAPAGEGAEWGPDRAFDLRANASTASEQEGMAAVVQAVGLLAGSEDALHSPFETKQDE